MKKGGLCEEGDVHLFGISKRMWSVVLRVMDVICDLDGLRVLVMVCVCVCPQNEQESGEEDDGDNDGFFVPHGYLSEGEGQSSEEEGESGDGVKIVEEAKSPATVCVGCSQQWSCDIIGAHAYMYMASRSICNSHQIITLVHP